MLIYLKPLSIFPELHSDTLFGAITYAISQLYPEKVDEMVKSFEDEPPFIISSTFPFIFKEDFENGKKIKFYPKIIFPQKSKDLEEKYHPKDFKEYKKYYGRNVSSGKVNPAIEYGFAFPLKCSLEEDK